MAEQSFIFLDRISLRTEKMLWEQGISSWDDFLAAVDIKGISSSRKRYYDRKLNLAKQLLRTENISVLAKWFPKSEQWRLYDLTSSIALDIETSGYYGDITVIGLHDGSDPFFLVRDKNLDYHLLERYLEEPISLLTFNGSSFDLPVIMRRFPKATNLFGRHVHIDLRHVASRLGYSGGLKKIELEFGISREGELEFMRGDHAIYLWNEYKETNDESALETLLAYNEADVANLFILADILIPRLWKETRSPYKELLARV